MSYQHPTFHGTTTTPVTPGSDEWARTVSASKVSALLGLSSFDSAYSLWARATGRVEAAPGNKYTDRGTRMEPSLLQYVEDKVPGTRVRKAPSYAHPDQPAWTAAPDALVFEGRRRTPFAIVEAKTSARSEDWGKEGTADIPAGYLAQIAWQFYVTGARMCYVPAVVNMDYRLYVVTWEDVAGDLPVILDAVRAWEACVAEDRAPDWDGSDATFETVKRMHPDIADGTEAVVETDLADRLWYADAQAKAWAEELKKAKSELLDSAGAARLVVDRAGRSVARRQPNKSGVSLYLAKPSALAEAA